MLYIPLSNLSAKAINRLKRIAAFRNPEFYAKQGMRLSTYDVPRIISCSELKDDYLAIPRGCEEDVVELLQYNQVKYHCQDETNHGKTSNIEFKGVLRQEQEEAMICMLPYNIGFELQTIWRNRRLGRLRIRGFPPRRWLRLR